MLPVKKTTQSFRTLEEIRQRKDELSEEIQQDNVQFTNLWNQAFVKREGNSKGEYISSLIVNGITAVDTFLMVRKLIKNYGSLFGIHSKSKKKGRK